MVFTIYIDHRSRDIIKYKISDDDISFKIGDGIDLGDFSYLVMSIKRQEFIDYNLLFYIVEVNESNTGGNETALY